MDYNYREEVYNDVKEYIENNYTKEELVEKLSTDRDAFEEDLDEGLWLADSVTGNGSGSYWFNAYKAEEALCHNFELYIEAEYEFGGDFNIIAESFSAERADVTIRCYLLRESIVRVLDELCEEYEEDIENFGIEDLEEES